MQLYQKIVTGTLGAGAIGGFAVLGVALTSPSFGLDSSGNSQEAALVRRFEGSPALEEIIKAQMNRAGFQIQYGILTGKPSAVVNVHDALKTACGTTEFGQSPVCQAYSEIPAQLAAQAEIIKRNEWRTPPTPLGFLSLYGISTGIAVSIIGAVAALYSFLQKKWTPRATF